MLPKGSWSCQTSQKLGSHDFWQIANSIFNKGKSDIPPLFSASEVLSLDDSGISLPVFPSRTKQKLHNISVTSKMIKMAITDLDSIPVVVLKNCEPELLYILAELFNMCLKESGFPDFWKALFVVPVFKNVGERSTAKNYDFVSLLSVISEVFEKCVNNKIVDHLDKCGLFRWGTHLYMSLLPSLCLSVCPWRAISQESYIIWSWFLVRMCKMTIFPVVFFIFSTFWFFDF